jgi:hypothetical protein
MDLPRSVHTTHVDRVVVFYLTLHKKATKPKRKETGPKAGVTMSKDFVGENFYLFLHYYSFENLQFLYIPWTPCYFWWWWWCVLVC